MTGSASAALAAASICIELSSNPVRRHGNNNGLPPEKFEGEYFMTLSGV